MPDGRRSRLSSSPAPTFTREAYALPSKPVGWQPLHLIFRAGKLPRLPEIHRPEILAVLKSTAYEKAVGPSKHSIKTLAWMGDAALHLAATKAVLLGPFEDKTNPHLSAIRSGLTNNRTFSYLTASYRILDHFAPTHASHGQKRYADFFEAYIGAAWISAKETREPDHIRDIESYLSKLFKPSVWPALESLMKGSDGLISAVRLEQDLESGSDGDVEDISVFDVPPTAIGSKGQSHSGKKKKNKRLKMAQGQLRQGKMAQIQESHRQHQRRDGFRAKQGVSPRARRMLSAGSSTRPIVLDE